MGNLKGRQIAEHLVLVHRSKLHLYYLFPLAEFLKLPECYQSAIIGSNENIVS
jgi:hypothetical protein